LQNKIAGIYTFRATLRVRLNVNAMQFQLGAYIVAFLPTAGMQVGNAAETDFILAHRFSKIEITQLQHVVLDVNRDTEVELVIPWKSTYNSFIVDSASAGYSNPGYVFMYPYVPLASGATGSNTAGYTLWAYYDDIELGTVTYPQMDNAISRRGGRSDFMTREQKGGAVSDTLDMVGSIAGGLSNVPLLSTIAAPIEGIANLASGFARMFGFSKPNTLNENTTRIVRAYFPSMANVDGKDVCDSMALWEGNHVSLAPEVFGTEIDEMSFDFLTSISTWYTTVTWTTGNATDTSLLTIGVNPAVGEIGQSDGAVTLYSMSPLAYITRFFVFWRGDLKYRFKIISTAFHTGRLLFTFEPYFYAKTPGVTNTATSAYVYRQVIDLREKREIEVTVPWVCYQSWLQSNKNMGQVKLLVLDPLVCPASVSTSIYIIVEILGGENMKFSCPQSMTLMPCTPSALQMDGDSLVFSKTTIGNASNEDEGFIAAEVTQGELIKSFRSLIKRFSLINYTTLTYSATSTLNIAPFYGSHQFSNGTIVTNADAILSHDIYAKVSNMYAMSRGGVRILNLPQGVNTTQSFIYSLNHVQDGATALSNTATIAVQTLNNFLWNSYCTATVFNALTAPNGVFIPQNTIRNARMIGYDYNSYRGTNYTNQVYDNTILSIVQNGTTFTSCTLMRAGADDASFGCFVSVMPHHNPSAPA